MSSFLQVKNEEIAADVWKKLILIHTKKGGMYVVLKGPVPRTGKRPGLN